MVPGSTPNVAGGGARVSVEEETQTQRGWSFRITVSPGREVRGEIEAGKASENEASSVHQLELWWVDYEHWGHGQVAPERVARVIVETLLEARPDLRLPKRFDASTARRWMPELDERVQGRL